MVASAWQQTTRGSAAYTLCQCLRATKQALRRWNKEVFGNIQASIRQLQAALDDVQQAPTSLLVLAKEKEISALLLEAQKKEEELRHQKAHITWLQTPDLNTLFFFFIYPLL